MIISCEISFVKSRVVVKLILPTMLVDILLPLTSSSGISLPDGTFSKPLLSYFAGLILGIDAKVF